MDVVTELLPREQPIVILEQEQLRKLGPDGKTMVPAYPLSDIVTCDALTALTRGLAAYLAQLSVVDPGGREHRLAHAFDTYAEPDDDAEYPYAAVYGLGQGNYSATGFTPSALSRCPLVLRGDVGKYIYSPHELEQPVAAEVWAEDPGDRVMLGSMIETASVPALFTSALRLVLPFYYNQVCSFSLLNIEHMDDEPSAKRRYRKLRITYQGNVPVTRSIEAGKAKISVKGEVGSDDDF